MNRPKSTEKTLKLASLQEISNVLGASYDFNKLLNIILETMLRQTHANSGSLMLFDKKQKELRIKAFRGIKKSIVKRAHIKIGKGIAGIVARSKKPLIIDNTNFYTIFKKKPRKNLKSSISIPLLLADKLIGVINLNRIPGAKEFTEEELNIFAKFASESSIAIENAKLYIDAEEKIQHLFRFNVISCALNSATNQESLFEVLNVCIFELFPFDIYSLLIIEKNKYTLLICSQNSLSHKTINFLKRNLSLVIYGLKKKKINARSIEVILKKVPGPTKRFKKKVLPKDIKSILNTPITSKGNTRGMLSIYSLKNDGFNQKNQQSLITLSNHVAVAIENTILYRNLRTTYLSTIKALAQAIEEKDPCTRGHSDLVSYYAVSIAQALNLPKIMIEGIQIAGILHDIGKIGIPEKILAKPSTLTYAEYEIIKNHPAIGKRILEPVNFYLGELNEPAKDTPQDLMNNVIINKKLLEKVIHPLSATLSIINNTDLSNEIKTMIYHHHERHNGGGYPNGIKGDQIPIGSRILAVADTFEAMTADRPYRKAFSVQKAIKLLKKCTPDQLDPKIVDIFVELIKKKFIKLKEKSN
ncbi:MAG: HD domain-containing phosphohydrolase [Candidatus Omnitrophota bacterium]